MDFMDQILTRPAGKFGVRFVGFKNPSVFLKRTILNRNEAFLVAQDHDFELKVTKAGDPMIEILPAIDFSYVTKGEWIPAEDDPYRLKGRWATVTRKGKKIPVMPRRANFSLGAASLFTTTTKMSASSWSLTAGPTEEGGTCAASGFYKRPDDPRIARAYQVALKTFLAAGHAIDPSSWICHFCYAGKSNYMHRNAQYSQVARLIWLKGMFDMLGPAETADLMMHMVRHHLSHKERRAKNGESTRYFRIHDSGDFTLNPDTYRMWSYIAQRMPQVHFWAPTRMWVFPKFVDRVRQNPPPPNLTIRPSALHSNDMAPGSGFPFAKGSTAHLDLDPVLEGISDWNCPVYMQEKNGSCSRAKGPKRENGCRACWDYPKLRVSYKVH